MGTSSDSVCHETPRHITATSTFATFRASIRKSYALLDADPVELLKKSRYRHLPSLGVPVIGTVLSHSNSGRREVS